MTKRIRLFLLGLLMVFLAVFPAFRAVSETAAAPEASAAVDLDLSAMSGTVVYAQVYNLLCDPSPWLGKTLRMAGFYSAFEDPATGAVYHACVIPDATACCAQGIEFVRAGEPAWPEDYPGEAAGIVVTGRLELYEENGVRYLHLVDAEMELTKEDAS